MSTIDPSQLKVAKQVTRKDILFGLARVPETSRVFVGSSDGNVYQLDLANEKAEPTEVARHESYVTSVAIAGDVVVSGGYDHRLVWTSVNDAKTIRSVDAHQRWIRQVVASPDQKLIASVADDMVCRLWQAADGKMVHELRGHDAVTPHHFPSMLYAVAFSADGKHLATGDRVGRIVVWDVATGKQLQTLDASGLYTWDPTQRRHSIGGIRSVAFSPDGTQVVAGGVGKIGNIDHLDAPARLEVFDWRAGKRTQEIVADTKLKGLIEQIAFTKQGDWFVGAGGGNGGLVMFCQSTTGKILFQDTAPMHVHGIAMSESSDTIYAAGHNKLVVWSLAAAKPAT